LPSNMLLILMPSDTSRLSLFPPWFFFRLTLQTCIYCSDPPLLFLSTRRPSITPPHSLRELLRHPFPFILISILLVLPLSDPDYLNLRSACGSFPLPFSLWTMSDICHACRLFPAGQPLPIVSRAPPSSRGPRRCFYFFLILTYTIAPPLVMAATRRAFYNMFSPPKAHSKLNPHREDRFQARTRFPQFRLAE